MSAESALTAVAVVRALLEEDTEGGVDVDITVYLPDELGKWAKEHELPVSRMLRDAVEDEKRRQEAVAKVTAEDI